ncbi:MAG: GTP-binding protein [Candidatus Staskawiczbacteria bacterium]|nr:GTP-binding protein [Candidatus Staskawiczbacteria bacterium]
MSQENIRNFSIIAHIDHGKSTLADRLLELTGTIDPKKMMPQFLDSMDLEREKGITIKLKAIRMNYQLEGKDYILNLVDTPGHVDFSYEVSRSLEAVEGAVLLVDVTQGIQAQTLANLELAKKQNLKIIPVVNKIDSPIAKVDETIEELSNLLDVMPDEIIKISAKDGTNVLQVLETIIKQVPPPKESTDNNFRALIFDSEFDSFKGVIVYPENPEDFENLKVALGKLKLNDPALVFEQEMKEALGRGFNCGFLGTLHIEIISERLEREYGLSLVISTPSVVYKILDSKGKETLIHSASDWPDQSRIKSCEEPWVSLEVIAPSNQMGKLMEILKSLKGNYVETNYLSPERAVIIFETPLRGIIANLYEKIKTASQGYASMNYKMLGYRPAQLVKMEILIAGKKEEAFSKIVAEDEAYAEGKRVVEKLKDVLPKQMFSVALQAVVGGKIIARETIKAYMKDVAGYLYGGDVTRKNKLRDKQKKGKKLMKEKGRVNVPTKAFLEVFRA